MRVCRFVLLLIVTAGLAQPAFAVSVERRTWAQLGYNQSSVPDGTIVTDIDIDLTGRTWFVTSLVGATALSGSERASGFPLTTTDGLFATTLSSVAFGISTRDASGSDEDHFFIGSSNNALGGLQYGVFTNTLEVGNDLLNDDLISAANDDPNAEFVTGLDSAGTDFLWVATEAGLVQVPLPDRTAGNYVFHDEGYTRGELAGSQVVDADTLFSGAGGAFYTHVDGVSMVVGTSIFKFTTGLLGFSNIGGLSVTVGGDLWVAERTSASSSARNVQQYLVSDLLAWAAGGPEPGPNTPPGSNSTAVFDPSASLSFFTGPREISDIAVDDLTGAVWITTRNPSGSSAQGGAFFQVPVPVLNETWLVFNPHLCGLGADWEDPTDDVNGPSSAPGAPGSCTGWHPVPQPNSDASFAINEDFGAVKTDIAGNVWLGTDDGARMLIARTLSLDKSRYLGIDAVATARVEDDLFLGDSVDINITVGSTSATYTVNDTDNDGIFEQQFGFTLDGNADPQNPSDPNLPLFPVNSTTEGVDIVAEYTFPVPDPQAPTRTLFANAIWANIADFEDDLLIGGPCFLRAIEGGPR